MYVDGFLIAAPTIRREAFRRYAEDVAAIFKEHGAIRIVEAWADDVPAGRLNSMHSAVLRKDDETVVFAWIAWPDKAARDAGLAKVAADPRNPAARAAMPFDGARMIFGGFEVIVDV